MKKHNRYSKGLHFLVLVCFLMPFFNTSCEENKESTEDTVVLTDTVKTEIVNIDKANIVTEVADSVALTQPNSTTQTKKDDPFASVPFLKPILNPSKDVYSGLGIILTHFALIIGGSVIICFLLLIICLLIKFIEPTAKKSILLLDIFAFIVFVFSRPYSFDYQYLWGWWTCLVFLFLLTVYDIYLARAKPNKDVEDNGL